MFVDILKNLRFNAFHQHIPLKDKLMNCNSKVMTVLFSMRRLAQSLFTPFFKLHTSSCPERNHSYSYDAYSVNSDDKIIKGTLG